MQTETVGSLIDGLFDLREERRELAATDRILKTRYESLETRLMAALDGQEMTQARGGKATATVCEDDYATVVDWDRLYQYVAQNQAFHLLQRRINNAPWKEFCALNGQPVPGTDIFRKRTIALRRI
jgi:hypothetical protein